MRPRYRYPVPVFYHSVAYIRLTAKFASGGSCLTLLLATHLLNREQSEGDWSRSMSATAARTV